jgi:hypothetical protein
MSKLREHLNRRSTSSRTWPVVCADATLVVQVWMASDASLLAAAGAEGALKHAHYFTGGIIGGELLTLSRHPIAEARAPPIPAW